MVVSFKDPIKSFKFNQEESKRFFIKFIKYAEFLFHIVEHPIFLDLIELL